MEKPICSNENSRENQDFLICTPNVEITARDKYGRLLWVKRRKNIVVTVGREQIARMLAEGLSNPITHYAWGSGGHNPAIPSENYPAQVGDTSLAHEIFRKSLFSVQYPTPSSVKFIGILEPPEIVGSEISEQGLFHQNGVMFAKLTYPLIHKGPVQLEFKWEIHI